MAGSMEASSPLCGWFFPCTTFSQDRKPTLRSTACVAGLPQMLADPRTARLIIDGNRTLEATFKFIRLCIALGVPAVAETPATSIAWADPRWSGMPVQSADVQCDFLRVWSSPPEAHLAQGMVLP